ncbi:MAG: acyl-CoA dehydrogenase family protein, partial [Brevibacterium aurantiacum]
MILDGYRGTWETQETDDLRELVRNFMNKEIVPHQDTFIDNHQVDRELWNRAGDAGLLCISIPEEYGGGGGTFAHEA